MRAHLNKIKKLGYQKFDNVDWHIMEKKMEKTPQYHKIWMTKHLSGFFGTNKYLQQQDNNKPSIYPCCKNPNVIEDERHNLH